MIDTLMKIFALMGALSMLSSIVFFIWLLVEWIKELIRIALWKHKYKHRFDKPPTASCYCKDCIWHNKESGKCHGLGNIKTAENWFCWKAEPLTKPPEADIEEGAEHE